MRYIVVDLEMHPLPNKFKLEKNICKCETIEIGAVMLDEELTEVSEFKRIIKPQYSTKIYPKYEKMTGITTAMVEQGDSFEDAFHSFTQWCLGGESQIEIIAWSDNDFSQLVREIYLKRIELSQAEKALMDGWRDFQKEFDHMLNKEYQVSLDLALLYADVAFEGHRHDALWDSRNTAELLRRTREEEDRIRIADRAESLFTTDPLAVYLEELFNFSCLALQC